MSSAISQLQDQIRSIGLDHSLEPADRHARLRAIRERLAELTGEADRRLSDTQKVREARASGAARELLWARGNADIREELLRLGDATEADLDEAGLLSHRELDRLQEEGLLEESVLGLAKRFDELLHKRDRTGKWMDMPGQPTPPDKIPQQAAAPLERPTPRKPGKVQPNVSTPENAERDEVAVRALADYLAVKAETAERDVTPALQDSLAGVPGARFEGLEHRLKSRASIISKIKRKRDKMPLATDEERAESITDLVRYTAVIPTDSYNVGVESALGALAAQGFEQVELENYWGGGDDYDALHVGLESPAGVRVELQFHTEESLEVKAAKNHPIYERFRESDDAHERWLMWEEMVENSKGIPRPRGVEELGPVKAKPAPDKPRPETFPTKPENAAILRDESLIPGPDEGLNSEYAAKHHAAAVDKLEAGTPFADLSYEEQHVVGMSVFKAYRDGKQTEMSQLVDAVNSVNRAERDAEASSGARNESSERSTMGDVDDEDYGPEGDGPRYGMYSAEGDEAVDEVVQAVVADVKARKLSADQAEEEAFRRLGELADADHGEAYDTAVRDAVAAALDLELGS